MKSHKRAKDLPSAVVRERAELARERRDYEIRAGHRRQRWLTERAREALDALRREWVRGAEEERRA